MKHKYVSYIRVSTARQGASGLGQDAQKHAVETFLNGAPLEAEFNEIESGKHSDRPKLMQALAYCRKHKAQLLIARIDRLSRNAGFTLALRDAGVDFIALDAPHADRLSIGIMALMAERERELISERTKAALAAAKRRGTKLGNPRLAAARKLASVATRRRADEFAVKLKPILNQLRKAGVTSLRQIAFCLNARGIKSPNGGSFSRQTIKAILARIAG